MSQGSQFGLGSGQQKIYSPYGGMDGSGVNTGGGPVTSMSSMGGGPGMQN